MKKTLLALAVLAAAGSAQAGIELYNQDGVSVNLKGDIEITYQNSEDSASMSQQIEDADFGFDIRYAVNDQVSVGAMWEFDGSTSNNAVDTKNGDNYVAVYTKDFGSLKLGRLCTAIDDIGIGNDYQYGVNAFFSSDTFECADEAARYDYDNGMFYATVGFVQNKLAKGGTTDEDERQGGDGNYFDGYIGARFADFDVKAIVADYDSGDSDNISNTLLGLEAAFGGIENLNLSVGYYDVSGDNYWDEDDAGIDILVQGKRDNSTWAVAADYTMGKWTFGTGYSKSNFDEGDYDESNWFVNAGYAVAPATTIYAEVAGIGGDAEVNNDNLLALGVKASF